MSCMVGVGKSKSSAKRMKVVEGMDASELRILENSVPRHIQNYFEGENLPFKIDARNPRYVDLCIRTGICEAADMAYKAMAESGRFGSSCDDGTIGEDILLVIEILRKIRSKCVPQEFSAGLLLMHLEILEGIKFSTAT